MSDGHSNDFFKYSDRGAKIACNIAVGMLKDLADLDTEDLVNMLEEKNTNGNSIKMDGFS